MSKRNFPTPNAYYTQAVLKFLKLDTQAQQLEAVAQRRSLSPYRLRYSIKPPLTLRH
ncbi:MAG: hypothetical protein LBJ00_01585 [Planctomycetaceae bacterium]|nr:hypothetical protein [Planctomycetaceae bacterium]